MEVDTRFHIGLNQSDSVMPCHCLCVSVCCACSNLYLLVHVNKRGKGRKSLQEATAPFPFPRFLPPLVLSSSFFQFPRLHLVSVYCVYFGTFVSVNLRARVNRFLSSLAPRCVAACTCLRRACVHVAACVCVSVCALITHTFEDAPAPPSWS